MSIFIETERFIIREIFPTDLEGMFELHSDPEVHRYLGNKFITTRDEAMELIHFVRNQYADFGIGRWAVVDKRTNDFIGWTGLELVTESRNNHVNFYDLGYRLIKRHWGKGIATETALASLDYAFNKLNTNEVYAMADHENNGSNKVLKKVGMKQLGTFDFEGVKHNWYRITKADFESTWKMHSAL